MPQSDENGAIMKAAVFHRPGRIGVDEVPDASIKDPQDAIVRVTATAICGSDLHMYNGFISQTKPLVMGHEFMGIVEEVGTGVGKLKVGDHVVVPFLIACGACFFCSHNLPGYCEHSNPEKYDSKGELLTQKGGGMFGYSDLYGGYDGGQAEYVGCIDMRGGVAVKPLAHLFQSARTNCLLRNSFACFVHGGCTFRWCYDFCCQGELLEIVLNHKSLVLTDL